MVDWKSRLTKPNGEVMSEEEINARWDQIEADDYQNESIDSMQYADDGIRYDNKGNKWIEVDENNKPYNLKLRMEWAQRERTLENLSNDLKHERTERSLAQSEASYQRRRAQRAESRPRFFN